ncbi:hypothetical protein Adt_18469 [Abeliophyllum distichum]|uniref:Uncharacterized protein n=1 Tax=Abeliophyllum distichum TaxID=126358 RepID=A0ABD1TJH1_9LAMI
MLHRGDGAGDPPQQSPHRLDSACESVRFTVPPCYPSLTEVLEEQWTWLRSIIESYFELQGDQLPDEYWADKLVELRKTQQTLVASNGASLDERAITKEVLGEQRGHVRGVGQVSKGISPSLDLTAALKVPQRTFHQFSWRPPE